MMQIKQLADISAQLLGYRELRLLRLHPPAAVLQDGGQVAAAASQGGAQHRRRLALLVVAVAVATIRPVTLLLVAVAVVHYSGSETQSNIAEEDSFQEKTGTLGCASGSTCSCRW